MIDKARLEKLVGMLGSDHDGERSNAAAFINRMAKEEKLTIVELMRKGLGTEPVNVRVKDPGSWNRDWGRRYDYDPYAEERAEAERRREASRQRNAEEQRRREREERERQARERYTRQQQEAARAYARANWAKDTFEYPDGDEGTPPKDPPKEQPYYGNYDPKRAERRAKRRNSGESII